MIKLSETFTDYVQIDVMDGEFVRSRSFAMEKLKFIHTTASFEMHLMVREPSSLMAGVPLTNQPLSVSPLTWSHAAFVTTVLEYLDKLGEVEVCPHCEAPMFSHEREGR